MYTCTLDLTLRTFIDNPRLGNLSPLIQMAWLCPSLTSVYLLGQVSRFFDSHFPNSHCVSPLLFIYIACVTEPADILSTLRLSQPSPDTPANIHIYIGTHQCKFSAETANRFLEIDVSGPAIHDQALMRVYLQAVNDPHVQLCSHVRLDRCVHSLPGASLLARSMSHHFGLLHLSLNGNHLFGTSSISLQAVGEACHNHPSLSTLAMQGV